jgi:hypothetical protein
MAPRAPKPTTDGPLKARSAAKLDPNWTPRGMAATRVAPTKPGSLQAFHEIGETGFEPATARPPAGEWGLASVAYPRICRVFLF